MSIKRKALIFTILLFAVFLTSFSIAYRDNIRKDITSFYTKYIKSSNLKASNKNAKVVNANKSEKTTVDSSKDETIIKKDTDIIFVDRKHKINNAKDEVTEDELKQATSDSEGIVGKKVKDIYSSYKAKGYRVEAKSDKIVCVKIHTKNKFVPKIKGDIYEIYAVDNNGELVLNKSGDHINHKSQDEIDFNKDPQEYDTIEQAIESLSDFTS